MKRNPKFIDRMANLLANGIPKALSHKNAYSDKVLGMTLSKDEEKKFLSFTPCGFFDPLNTDLLPKIQAPTTSDF